MSPTVILTPDSQRRCWRDEIIVEVHRDVRCEWGDSLYRWTVWTIKL